MLMYPKEYLDFSQLMKKYVVLNVMIKVLEVDRKKIKQSSCKLAKVYDDILNEVQWKIEGDLRSIRREMRSIGGTVIEELQQPTVRIVKAKFRGFIYTHRFLNYLLQAESEKMLKLYFTKTDVLVEEMNIAEEKNPYVPKEDTRD